MILLSMHDTINLLGKPNEWSIAIACSVFLYSFCKDCTDPESITEIYACGKIVPYHDCILITLSHKNKLWEESATDEAIGVQRGHEELGQQPPGKVGGS